MDIILPVAGLGSRLRPQTWSKPKPLVSVAGKPILEHVLDRVMPLQPDQLVFITGYLGDQIESWARSRYDIPQSYVVQPAMRGQTDALIRAREIATGEALILFPDMLFDADFSLIANSDADVIMFTKEVDDPSKLGIAVTEGDRIVKLVEKPKDPVSKLAVIGIYYVRSMPLLYEAIEEQMRRGISLNNEYFIADAIQVMIDAGHKVVPAPVKEWEDCGNEQALLSTNRFLLDRIDRTTVDTRANVIQPSYVDATAVIERSIVGPYASIGKGAVIRDAIVRNSIVEDGAQLSQVIVDGSIIGRNARVEGSPASLNMGDDSAIIL